MHATMRERRRRNNEQATPCKPVSAASCTAATCVAHPRLSLDFWGCHNCDPRRRRGQGLLLRIMMMRLRGRWLLPKQTPSPLLLGRRRRRGRPCQHLGVRRGVRGSVRCGGGSRMDAVFMRLRSRHRRRAGVVIGARGWHWRVAPLAVLGATLSAHAALGVGMNKRRSSGRAQLLDCLVVAGCESGGVPPRWYRDNATALNTRPWREAIQRYASCWVSTGIDRALRVSEAMR
jgi:hypothetical protein